MQDFPFLFSLPPYFIFYIGKRLPKDDRFIDPIDSFIGLDKFNSFLAF